MFQKDQLSGWNQYPMKITIKQMRENKFVKKIKYRISSSTYVAVNKLSKQVVGIIDIRHSLSEKYYYSGHIGYSVRPSMRGKGFGTEILHQGIEEAKRFNIKK